jgi:hypothetical protein
LRELKMRSILFLSISGESIITKYVLNFLLSEERQ